MNEQYALKNAILASTAFVLLLVCIKWVELIWRLPLQQFGVQPQEWLGLGGIVFGPLIHGSWEHLLSNSLPLLLMGSMLLYGYPKSRFWVLALIWLGSGLGVWLFGREATHYGASGITHGMFFYLLLVSILRRDKRSVALMMMAFFMYGSMVLTILPQEPGISFEYHLFGAVFGVLGAIGFYKLDPKPAVKTYDWERPDDVAGASEQESNSEDAEDLIGDLWQQPPPPLSETEEDETAPEARSPQQRPAEFRIDDNFR